MHQELGKQRNLVAIQIAPQGIALGSKTQKTRHHGDRNRADNQLRASKKGSRLKRRANISRSTARLTATSACTTTTKKRPKVAIKVALESADHEEENIALAHGSAY